MGAADDESTCARDLPKGASQLKIAEIFIIRGGSLFPKFEVLLHVKRSQGVGSSAVGRGNFGSEKKRDLGQRHEICFF